MEFFGMGTMEILLILVLAVVIFGPGRIVEIGRTLGKMMRTLKKASFDLTAEVTKELETKEQEQPPSKGEKS